jgi:hypothetical protein
VVKLCLPPLNQGNCWKFLILEELQRKKWF